MYGIEISYSWGDCEDGLYGKFDTEESAFATACELAGKEAYVQNEEFEDCKTATIYIDGYNKRIDLHYAYDDTWCYYRIKEHQTDFEREASEMNRKDLSNNLIDELKNGQDLLNNLIDELNRARNLHQNNETDFDLISDINADMKRFCEHQDALAVILEDLEIL